MFFSLSPTVRGALFSLIGFTIWACADAMTKGAGLGGIAPYTIVAISSWSAVLVVFLSVLMRGKTNHLRPKRWKLHLLRVGPFIVGSIVNAVAFTNLPLTSVYIGLFSAPFIISIIGSVFMNEKMSARRVTAIIVGFAGVLLALLPEIGANTAVAREANETLGYIALLAFLFFFVTDTLFLRVMGRTETIESMAFVSFGIRGVILLPILYIEQVLNFPFSTLLPILGMGALAGIGYLFVSEAYKLAPVSIVSPFQYTHLVTGAVLGFLMWGDVPSAWVWAGGILIVTSSLLVGREARKQPPILAQDST